VQLAVDTEIDDLQGNIWAAGVDAPEDAIEKPAGRQAVQTVQANVYLNFANNDPTALYQSVAGLLRA